MYVIDPPLEREVKVYLCYGHGKRVYSNLWQLCYDLTLSWIQENVGENYGSSIKIVTKRSHGFYYDKETEKFGHRHPEESYVIFADYILRTEDGKKLTAKELEPVYWEIRRSKWVRKPRQGRKCARVYRGFKHPKTANEKRQAFQNKDEGEPPIRARRSQKNIITAWDDNMAHNDANWKTQSRRRKQYRPV